MEDQPTLAVIGGSGLYTMSGLKDIQEHDVTTPFGKPARYRHRHLGELLHRLPGAPRGRPPHLSFGESITGPIFTPSKPWEWKGSSASAPAVRCTKITHPAISSSPTACSISPATGSAAASSERAWWLISAAPSLSAQTSRRAFIENSVLRLHRPPRPGLLSPLRGRASRPKPNPMCSAPGV